MRTKPYAGEKVIDGLRKVSWWGPGDVSVSQALFLDPMMQQQIRNGTYHSGQFFVTNKRIIFENIKSDSDSSVQSALPKSTNVPAPAGMTLPENEKARTTVLDAEIVNPLAAASPPLAPIAHPS